MAQPEGNSRAWKAFKPFITGSMAGCTATCCIQPVDMVKVRIQLMASSGGSTSPIAVAGDIFKNQGVKGFYSGLDSALVRQAIYTGARLGLYDYFTDMARGPDGKVGALQTAGCAMTAGGLGAFIANPPDLCLIRMQSDAVLPPEQRRGYSSVGNALRMIVRDEGFAALFTGWKPTVFRAMCQNFGMLATNTQAKQFLAGIGASDTQTVFGAAALSGFCASVCALPPDFIKTQIQKMVPDPKTGEMPFKGPVDCLVKTVSQKGFLTLYAGFPIFYLRIGGHATITLIAQDKVKKMWASRGL